MIVRLELTLIHHGESGWSSLHVDSHAADYSAEPIRVSHEWRKMVECPEGEDEMAHARGMLEWGLMHHRGTLFRLREMGRIGPVS